MSNSSRVGETRTMNNGLKATIIAYRGCYEVDIQFEDGTIVTNKQYGLFKRGAIGHPEENPRKYNPEKMLGETITMKNGLKCEIIAWRNWNDIDVRFEDGTVVKSRCYTNFKRKCIAHPDVNPWKINPAKKLGEVRTMKNGMKAEIIGWNNSTDITVRFEDGTVVENVLYPNFKNCLVANPSVKRILTDPTERIGQTRKMNNGLNATIISWNGCSDISIKFEDGVIVKNKTYGSFTRGSIAHPGVKRSFVNTKSHLGETRKMRNNMDATIIKYDGYHKVTVQFEDGAVVGPRLYDWFIKGRIGHPYVTTPNIRKKGAYKTERVGITKKMTNGMNATLINWDGANNITVQFEDGVIVEHKTWRAFNLGYIKNPNVTTKWHKRTTKKKQNIATAQNEV